LTSKKSEVAAARRRQFGIILLDLKLDRGSFYCATLQCYRGFSTRQNLGEIPNRRAQLVTEPRRGVQQFFI